MLCLAAASALASQRQPTLAPEALSKAKPGKSPPLSLDQINKVYDHGHPSNKVSAGPGSAGLVVHMYDLTERAGTGQMYEPGDARVLITRRGGVVDTVDIPPVVSL